MSWVDLDPGVYEIAAASISDCDDGHDDHYTGDDEEHDESDSTSEQEYEDSDDKHEDPLVNENDANAPVEAAAVARKRGRPRKPPGELKRLPIKTRQVLSDGYAVTEYPQTCCNYRYFITMRIETVFSSALPLAVAGMGARLHWIVLLRCASSTGVD